MPLSAFVLQITFLHLACFSERFFLSKYKWKRILVISYVIFRQGNYLYCTAYNQEPYS